MLNPQRLYVHFKMETSQVFQFNCLSAFEPVMNQNTLIKATIPALENFQLELAICNHLVSYFTSFRLRVLVENGPV